MTANEIIRKHYNVPRPVTDEEVLDELVNLRRKFRKGNLDDVQERLLNELVAEGKMQHPAGAGATLALRVHKTTPRQ